MLIETIRAAREPGWRELFRLYRRAILTGPSMGMLLIAALLNGLRHLLVANTSSMALVYAAFSLDFFGMAIALLVARFFHDARRGDLLIHLGTTGLPVVSIFAPLFDLLVGLQVADTLIEFLVMGASSTYRITPLDLSGAVVSMVGLVWLLPVVVIAMNLRRLPLWVQLISINVLSWILILTMMAIINVCVYLLQEAWSPMGASDPAMALYRYFSPTAGPISAPSAALSVASWISSLMAGVLCAVFAKILTRFIKRSHYRLAD